MITETKGLVLRQVKTVNSRRMIQLFTEKFGKISVGVSVSERGRGKGQQALHPFTYGDYELFIARGYYNLNKGQVERSFYSLGSDVDKYMAASYGLELCDKLLEEDQPAPELFALTVDFLEAMEARKSAYGTLLLAYKVKLLEALGTAPVLGGCCGCGREDQLPYFSVEEGGLLCPDCAAQLRQEGEGALLYEVDFVILSVLEHLLSHSIASLRQLAIEPDAEARLGSIIDRFITYHLDPGELKSGSLRIDGTEV